MLGIQTVLLQEEGQLVAEWLGNLLVEMSALVEVSVPSLGTVRLLVLLVQEEHRLKKRGEMRVRSVNNITYTNHKTHRTHKNLLGIVARVLPLYQHFGLEDATGR